MINIKTVLMLSVSCLTFLATKDVHANLNYNINSVESNLDTKHIYTHAHLGTKHLSSAFFSSPIAFNLRGLSIAPSGSNLSTSNFPQTTSLFSSPMAFNLRGVSIAPSDSHLSTSNFTLTASVCFITDTNSCKDGGFGGTGENPNWDLDENKRCKNEGYNVNSCSSVQVPVNLCPYNNAIFEKCACRADLKTCTKPDYGVGEACDGKYASCKTDNAKACKEDGYTNTCPSGQKIKASPRCPYDNSYGICCSWSCSINNSSPTCNGANTGSDGCGYNCYKCCDDTCPSYSAKNYSGALASTTGCGNKCYKCNCPNGSAPNFSGVFAGNSECGGCYRCSNACSSGSPSTNCSSKENNVRVATTECGGSCYECRYNPDCDARKTSCASNEVCNYNSCGICTSCSINQDCNATDKTCPAGCAKTNSCGKCTSCNSPDCAVTSLTCAAGCAKTNSCGKCTSCNNPPAADSCKSNYTKPVTVHGWCDFLDSKKQTGGKWIWCGDETRCTTYGGDDKHVSYQNYRTMQGSWTNQDDCEKVRAHPKVWCN